MRPINLLPAEAFARAATRRRRALWVLAALVYIGVLVAVTVVWNGRVQSAERDAEQAEAAITQLQAEARTLATAEDLRNEYDTNINVLQTVLGSDVAWGRVLNDFARLMPDRVWLESFAGAADTSVGGVGAITVSGRGFAFTDVSAWLRSLDSDRFPGVDGTWVTNALLAENPDAGFSLVNFDSTTGLTGAAVSNRLEERVVEVPE